MLWWLAGLLLVSGLLLLPGMLALRLQWDISERFIGPRSWYAAIHGFLAFAALMVMGALLAIHVRHGLRQKHSRKSGYSLLFVLPLIVLSGWGIYYIADESWSVGISLSHLLVALVMTVLLPLHWFLARQRKRSQR